MEDKKNINITENKPAGAGAGWLISYADMMTLIACFFILMMAFANYDPVGFTKKTIEISKHFNKDKYKSSDTKMKMLQEEVARHPELKNKLKVSVKDQELKITFSGSTLFNRNEYELKEESRVIIDTLIDLIKIRDPNYKIITEGHTDNLPLAKDSIFSSNWGLSGARAASVIQRFEYFGFNPHSLVSIGLSDTHPLTPNEDQAGNPILENIKVNNRVVIKVIEELEPKRKIKMGLGVYFDQHNKK
jgi:chemotaxis protein MotB